MFSPFELSAVWLSLKVATIASAACFPFAFAIAWWLARYEFPGKSIVNSVVHLPLVIPPVVIGYLLLVVAGENGIIGRVVYEWTGFTLSFNWKGAALASAIVALPLMVRALRTGIEYIDPRMERAAETLGAGRARIFFTIILPLTLPSMISAGLLGFSRALGEFGATITFVASIPGETQTLPLAIYQYLEMPGNESAALRLCFVAVILAFVAVGLSEYFQRKQKQYD